ncbi:MAG: hypothetical protein KME35_23795 [Aphanocapsa sp. GSE-SYN-MK-11-07L]|jgi:hypothetical protein|nr:hypothetical protein [Aphanocapsa sp. GSE-SYN-MK-11-07L]
MNRNDWECQFRQRLKQQLGLTPEQIKFPWRGFYNQRHSPEQAIAYLIKTNKLYPELGLLPMQPIERPQKIGL